MRASVMYLSIIVILSGIYSASTLNLWEIIDLKAVTFFEGITEYYHAARMQSKIKITKAYPVDRALRSWVPTAGRGEAPN